MKRDKFDVTIILEDPAGKLKVKLQNCERAKLAEMPLIAHLMESFDRYLPNPNPTVNFSFGSGDEGERP